MVSYTYFNNDLRKTMSELSPAEPSPVTWQYAYDDANRPQTLADPFGGTITFGYDMADRLTSKTFPNGVTTAIGYDTCSEVTGVTTAASGGGTLAGSTYGYDLAGNVVSRSDSDGTAAGFSYNGADQLTFESYAQSGTTSYIGYLYDHNGNRTSQTNSGAVTNYTYDAGDKLTSDSNGGTYSYDNNGNWTKLAGSASTYTFTYDAENRLDYYTAPGMSSAYSSNGMGLRVAESDSGSGEHDLINDGSGAGSPLLVDHNISARTVAHVYTPGLEQRDGLTGALHLMGVDALGSVRAFINDDSGQAVTDTQGYYGYGITRSRTGSDWMPFGFAGADGYQTDPNQLMLLGNREYHPFTGRFLTRDPAHAGSNDYEYCDDNPLRYADPSGLDYQGAQDYGRAMGAQPGDTIDERDVDANGNVTHQYWVMQGTSNGWQLAVGVAWQWAIGAGPQYRYYGPRSTQAQVFRGSYGWMDVSIQMASGQKSGGVGTAKAFVWTMSQFFTNGTQAQLGAFSWNYTYGSDGKPNGVDISNTISYNSFWLHVLPSYSRYDLGPGGNVDQVIHENLPTVWHYSP